MISFLDLCCNQSNSLPTFRLSRWFCNKCGSPIGTTLEYAPEALVSMARKESRRIRERDKGWFGKRLPGPSVPTIRESFRLLWQFLTEFSPFCLSTVFSSRQEALMTSNPCHQLDCISSLTRSLLPSARVGTSTDSPKSLGEFRIGKETPRSLRSSLQKHLSKSTRNKAVLGTISTPDNSSTFWYYLN